MWLAVAVTRFFVIGTNRAHIENSVFINVLQERVGRGPGSFNYCGFKSCAD